MEKTAEDLLDESPPGTIANFLEIKKVLTGLADQSGVEESYKIGEMAMVVVILIATMAFQAAVSPPGGVWQDDTSSHRAGESVMASTHPHVYKHFTRANTTAFVSSLLIIFLISTGLTLASVTIMGIAVLAMLVALASIAVSYGASLMVITPFKGAQSFVPTILIVALMSAAMLGFFFVFAETKESFSKWKIKKRQLQGDYRDHRLSRRVLHRIFKWYVDESSENDSDNDETDHHHIHI